MNATFDEIEFSNKIIFIIVFYDWDINIDVVQLF